MNVEQLMARTVHSSRPDDSLRRAAETMWKNDCGWLPVCRGDGSIEVVGVITDRDICMCGMFRDTPLGQLRVSEAMQSHVRTCRPGDSLADAEQAMREARVRRLPVVDDQGLLIGMISLADLAHEAERELAAETREITEEEIGGTLAAICEPHGQRVAAA